MDSLPPAPDESTATPPPGATRRPGPMRRLLQVVAIVVALLVTYLLVAPAPIDPAAYDPPAAPSLSGPTLPNDALAAAEILAPGYPGPEGVCVDPQGNVYAGLEDGRIIRVAPDGSVTAPFNTGGRPLGLELDAQGNLIVADGLRGLVSVNPAGEVTVLTREVHGKPFGFPDDLAVASDGVVYFSDASSKFPVGAYLYDLLEARPHGQLLSYDPATKETKVLLDDLYFANGVALSQQEDFLIINETYRYRIRRYWLKGEKAGTSEIFADNLPGFPDNVSSNGRGSFWLALFTVRNATVDRLHPYPWAKGVMSKLPKALWPQPEPYAFVVRLDENGQIVESFQDPAGKHLYAITSVYEHDGYLYLGSLYNDRIGKFKLP
ncbi:MAG: strictosidine synthase family protein [Planctomycetaceae bacterium]|nr:strictosidine synthase family protein [Planctomycetaceae bacterium]